MYCGSDQTGPVVYGPALITLLAANAYACIRTSAVKPDHIIFIVVDKRNRQEAKPSGVGTVGLNLLRRYMFTFIGNN